MSFLYEEFDEMVIEKLGNRILKIKNDFGDNDLDIKTINKHAFIVANAVSSVINSDLSYVDDRYTYIKSDMLFVEKNILRKFFDLTDIPINKALLDFSVDVYSKAYYDSILLNYSPDFDESAFKDLVIKQIKKTAK